MDPHKDKCVTILEYHLIQSLEDQYTPTRTIGQVITKSHYVITKTSIRISFKDHRG
jgi:hypothetical protein